MCVLQVLICNFAQLLPMPLLKLLPASLDVDQVQRGHKLSFSRQAMMGTSMCTAVPFI